MKNEKWNMLFPPLPLPMNLICNKLQYQREGLFISVERLFYKHFTPSECW